METKSKFIQKVNKYTEKGYLFSKEWTEISQQAENINKTLINGHRVNLDQLIRKKFKIRNRDNENIDFIMRNEGFVKNDEIIEELNEVELKTHKRLMNGNLFIIDNTIIFENEFEILKKATYYNTKSTLHKKEVLLKHLKQEHTKNRDDILLFYEGYEKIKNIDHPNVISGVDKWIDKAGLFYAIEYIEGQTLSNFLKKNKTIRKDEIKFIVSSLLKGLSYLHKNGIFIGNLNPNNIVVSKDSQIIITDMKLFGDHCQIEKSENFIEAQLFVAPEISKEGASFQSDIYSFGKIVSLLCTGQVEDISKIKKSGVPELFEVAFKSTNQDTSQRYEKVSDILKSRKSFSFSKITKPIADHINYIYIILSGLLILALSNRIVSLLGTDYVFTKQIVTIVGFFTIIFPIMIIIFNLVLKNENK